MALNGFVLGVKSDICFVTKIKKWDLPFFLHFSVPLQFLF